MDNCGSACYAEFMVIFCFLWMPLFYLFWRGIAGSSAAGGIWALLLGSIVALIQFFLGPLVEPGGFGLSRWASGCIDIVVLPALLPLLVYFLLIALRIIAGIVDFPKFALLWLIPTAAMRALSWSSLRDPILMVLVPVLWTAIAVGVPFFIAFIQSGRPALIVIASLAILFVPFAAASSYWAFFSQNLTLGILFLLSAIAPLLVSASVSFLRAGE